MRVLGCKGLGKEAEQLLDDARLYCLSHGVDSDSVCRQGEPREEILEEARSWEADLIVLGCSGRSRTSARLFGSSALDVLRRADRPLFFSQ
jgi:nucleotide-binding universal stress UspA family protein